MAILLVIVPHIAAAGMLPGPAVLKGVADTVAHGVDLFFILSGFGLAYPFIAPRSSTAPLVFDTLSYAFNRLYRIMPMFYVTIALTYAVIFCLQHAGRFTNDAVLFVPQSAYEAIAQLVLLDRMNLPVNPGLWTIALQFRWYAVFPLFLLLFVKSKRAFYLCLGLAWIGFLFTRARSMDLGTLPLFLLGIVAADLVARRDRIMRYAVWLLPVAVAVALLWDRHAMVPDAWGEESHFTGQPTSFGWHMVAFCLVLAAVRWSPLRAVLSWSPLVALGAASFSIYLVHQPVLAVAQGVYGAGGGVAAFVVSIVAGVALWWGVERPISDPGRRRTMRERARPAIGRMFAFFGLPGAFTVRP